MAASLAADLAGYLISRGVNADAVLERAGLARLSELAAGGRIAADRMNAFWREAIAETNDPHLGLHAGAAFLPGALDIVGYVMLSSHTAADAVRRGARLMRLLNDGLALDVERTLTTTVCRVRVLDVHGNAQHSEARQVSETLLMGAVHQLRLLTGRAVVPREVRLRHTMPPEGAAEHAKLFGVTPMFGADDDSLTLDNADLDVVLRSGNAELLAAFESHADAVLTTLHAHEALSRRVLREIVLQLKGEVPTIPQIAKALAMSARNVQRGLATEGTTFQTLLDEARRELALRHLAAPDATVAKVAWLVGFSEPSAFHRAFRRWTGHSPRALSVS